MTALHIIQGSNDISPQLVISNMIAHLVKSTWTIDSFRRERRKSSDRRLSPIQKHSFLTFFSDSIHLLMAMTEDPVRSLRAKIASVIIWIVAILIVCQGFSLLSTLTSINNALLFLFFWKTKNIERGLKLLFRLFQNPSTKFLQWRVLLHTKLRLLLHPITKIGISLGAQLGLKFFRTGYQVGKWDVCFVSFDINIWISLQTIWFKISLTEHIY